MIQSPRSSLIGNWLVSEYIYNPDHTFAGINHQRRMLEKLENGNIRVTQICTPESALDLHPMGAFRGEWVFDLRVDGDTRHYLGPDVIGIGQMIEDGIMTGKGRWPRFGYDFTSFSILVTPDCQLTGGQFLDGEALVANIVGVAVAENEIGQFPQFHDLDWVSEIVSQLSIPTKEILMSLRMQFNQLIINHVH